MPAVAARLHHLEEMGRLKKHVVASRTNGGAGLELHAGGAEPQQVRDSKRAREEAVELSELTRSSTGLVRTYQM